MLFEEETKTMWIRCEHNKDSMFAIGPCEDCLKKLDTGLFNEKQSYHQNNYKDKRKFDDSDDESHYDVRNSHVTDDVNHHHVKWADEFNEFLCIDMDDGYGPRFADDNVRKVSFKPILKRRKSSPSTPAVCCVIVVHGQD